MTDEDLAFAPATVLSELVRSGTVSAARVVEAVLARAEGCNAWAHAYIRLTAADARAAAADCDAALAAGRQLGPLAGVPFAAKDLIDVAGVATTAGSRVLRDAPPAEADATVIARLRVAGAVSLGKTNLHEFAYGATGENEAFGTPINAWDPARLATGSSSGSTAAVAFGLAAAALGTDTGGSVRVPAALNGLVGLKPTYGRVPVHGVFPYCWSLDHVGFVARSVADAALLLQVAAGHDPADHASAREAVPDYSASLAESDLAGLRVGVPRSFYFERCDPEILAAAEAALDTLERAGARLIEIELPDMTHGRTVSLTVQMPEALSLHSTLLAEREDLYGDDLKAGLAAGQFILAEHYVRAKRMMSVYRRDMEPVFDKVDVLLTPATPLVAPRLGTVTIRTGGVQEPVGNALTRYTTFFNMTGHPAIVVPAGLHSDGLPMGVQLVSRHFDEAMLLRVARTIERDERHALPPAPCRAPDHQ